MQIANYNYNTTYGSSGAQTGYYQNCSSGHTYRTDASHYRQANNGDNWEGQNNLTLYW